MKLIISESQYNKLIQSDIDEDYPSTWSLDEFKQIPSYAGRMKYAETHLKKLASGSSRVVYQIDDEKVLKLAKNKKGLAQNETEISWGNDSYFGGILAKVYDSDESDLWVEMELARKVTPKKFMEHIGVTIENFRMYLLIKSNENNGKRSGYSIDDNIREHLDESDFAMSIIEFMDSTGAPHGDFGRLSSYGLVSEDGVESIVLIDFGLTGDIYDQYYK